MTEEASARPHSSLTAHDPLMRLSSPEGNLSSRPSASLECPACGVVGDPENESAFRLCGMHAGRPVRRCCRCSAALSIERAASGRYQALPLTPATWKAMKSAWESWEPWTATGWQQPDVIKDILACAAQEFTRYTP